MTSSSSQNHTATTSRLRRFPAVEPDERCCANCCHLHVGGNEYTCRRYPPTLIQVYLAQWTPIPYPAVMVCGEFSRAKAQ